jgi:hypothetical protein
MKSVTLAFEGLNAKGARLVLIAVEMEMAR